MNSHVAQPGELVGQHVGAPSQPTRSEREGRLQKLVANIHAGKPIVEALVDAGWPPKQAKKGWAAVPKRATAMMLERDIKAERTGEFLVNNPDKFKLRVLGKNYETMMENEKKTVDASALLIKHKAISAEFFQEQQNNVVIIQAPADWKPKEFDDEKIKRLPPVSQQKLPDYE